MKKINLNNYEAFLLDYIEGNLSGADVAALKAFAVMHPELNIDLENTDLPYVDSEQVSVDFKKDLFKTEERISDQQLLEYLEGDLSGEEKSEFEKKLRSDKSLADDLEIYRKTILVADKEETFPGKTSLIRSGEELLLNNTALLYVEGLLSEQERLEFEKKAGSDETLLTELHLYRRSRLVADTSVLYPDKESLKRKTRVLALFTVRNVAAAAAVLLLAGLITLVVRYNTVSPVEEFKLAKGDKNVFENKINKSAVSPQMNANDSEIEEQKQTLVADKIRRKGSESTSTVQSRVKDSLELIQNPTRVVKEEKLPGNLDFPEVKNSPDTMLVKLKREDLLRKDDVSEMKRQTLLAVEEDEDDEQPEETQAGRGFWKRAVKLARQANGLGIKAVNGDEKANNYVLSFNSFSVEKK
jgi:hypothetical protein